MLLRANLEKLSVPKVSPKNSWKFDFLSTGYGKPVLGPDKAFEMRFRVYAQDFPSATDTGLSVCRALMRLWDFNVNRLRLDHALNFANRTVDVYLCKDGKAGGEQLMGVEAAGSRVVHVNTIYIYDIASFTDPLERIREIAHEYGHATLPPVGSFEQPENWANGHLGERLYLLWLRNAIRAGFLSPDDAMGVSLEALDAYIGKNVTPLIREAMENGPNASLLKAKSAAAMDHYLGLALYSESLLGPKAFARALVLPDDQSPMSFVKAVLESATESGALIPKLGGLKGRKVWLPVGKGKLSGAAPILKREGWVQVAVGDQQISVLYPSSD